MKCRSSIENMAMLEECKMEPGADPNIVSCSICAESMNLAIEDPHYHYNELELEPLEDDEDPTKEIGSALQSLIMCASDVEYETNSFQKKVEDKVGCDSCSVNNTATQSDIEMKTQRSPDSHRSLDSHRSPDSHRSTSGHCVLRDEKLFANASNVVDRSVGSYIRVRPREELFHISKSTSSKENQKIKLRKIKNDTLQTPYPCDVCQKLFRNNCRLKLHKLSHEITTQTNVNNTNSAPDKLLRLGVKPLSKKFSKSPLDKSRCKHTRRFTN